MNYYTQFHYLLAVMYKHAYTAFNRVHTLLVFACAQAGRCAQFPLARAIQHCVWQRSVLRHCQKIVTQSINMMFTGQYSNSPPLCTSLHTVPTGLHLLSGSSKRNGVQSWKNSFILTISYFLVADSVYDFLSSNLILGINPNIRFSRSNQRKRRNGIKKSIKARIVCYLQFKSLYNIINAILLQFYFFAVR